MKPGSIRLDVASAYVVTAARVGAWALVSALVYRKLGAAAFAVLALIRATAGLLAYTSLGLAPAMVRLLAEADKPPAKNPVPTPVPAPAAPAPAAPAPAAPVGEAPVLQYASRANQETPGFGTAPTGAERVYASGESLALRLASVGLVIATLYALFSNAIHSNIPYHLAGDTRTLAFTFGAGIVMRLLSDVPAGLLQVRGRIAEDNLLQFGAEVVWTALSAAWLWGSQSPSLGKVGTAFACASGFLLVARNLAAMGDVPGRLLARWRGADPRIMRRLLAYGSVVAVAQAADFLYVPTDYLLIDWLLGTPRVAVYAPALQIDAALLLVVAALANVLLPRVAVAHASGDVARVRAYYVRGTVASLAALACAAVAVWLASPMLLRLWLGSDLPETRALLPWVLVHTVVGGSGAVGRSVLLGMGKVKPFTTAVIIAGVANVLLSYTFVRFFGMGLYGIVLGTIVVVVGRSAIWTPWYVLRALGSTNDGGGVKEGK